jgi:hypothetical protein
MKTTLKDLENLKQLLESITKENLKIDQNHLGYALLVNYNQGGVDFLINGRYSKKELYQLMYYFLKGLNYERK